MTPGAWKGMHCDANGHLVRYPGLTHIRVRQGPCFRCVRCFCPNRTADATFASSPRLCLYHPVVQSVRRAIGSGVVPRHAAARATPDSCCRAGATRVRQCARCAYRVGKSCRKHHPLDTGLVVNNYGLPMRPGAVRCEFFARTGICKFGRACIKHHPHLKPGPPIRKTPFKPPRLIEMPADSPYYLVDEVTGGFPEFPQNPGKPPCPHFVRTGHCGYGARCPHHHPVEYAVKRNMDGLPLRPGKELCKFYVAKRACAYGEACVLHHPNIRPKREMQEFGGQPMHGRRPAPGGHPGGGPRPPPGGRPPMGHKGRMGRGDGMYAQAPPMQYAMQVPGGDPRGGPQPVMIMQQPGMQVMAQGPPQGPPQGMPPMQARPPQMAQFAPPPMQQHVMPPQQIAYRPVQYGP